MNVRVGDTGPNGCNYFCQLMGGNLLGSVGSCYSDEVVGSGGSAEAVRPRTAGMGSRAGVVRRRRRRLAQPDDDPPVHAPLAEVDMGLCRVRLKPAVRQRPANRLLVGTDVRVELATGLCRNGRHLLVADQPGMEVVTVTMVVAGHGRHGDQWQDEEQGKEPNSSGVWHCGLL